jgi:hypothetical protein
MFMNNYYELFQIDPKMSLNQIQKILLQQKKNKTAQAANAMTQEEKAEAMEYLDRLLESRIHFTTEEARREYDNKLITNYGRDWQDRRYNQEKQAKGQRYEAKPNEKTFTRELTLPHIDGSVIKKI